ncbi:mitochondrial carrier [Cystobasidium minutum MCA 4210]|uniref:mitochondrial carrier n=1 Tax=Cystobasidium minutum MCA 4210 TaxID=1397322 RepID=UPI0034CF9E8D|eukprot:jgi/Rhomi1/12381/CE12380_350
MSTSTTTTIAEASTSAIPIQDAPKKTRTSATERAKGFAAGTASGLTKLVVGHPFDTVKTRMQCSPIGMYSGPLECLKSIVSKEGVRALYKGASPPAVGWAITDAILLGSLHNYRLLLAKHTPLVRPLDINDPPGTSSKLSVPGHALAGMFAGFTVALAATPVELVKVQLQMQFHSTSTSPLFSTSKIPTYTSPIGFAKKIYVNNGITGFWHALPGTMLQRMWFGVMFGAYDIQMRWFRQTVTHKDGSRGPRLAEGTANFIAGGMGSNLFWIFAYPFDNVKNRMMSDSITNPKYPTWASAARSIWREGGVKAVYRGFLPCILRAFPTNGGALFVWETSMRLMNAEKVR